MGAKSWVAILQGQLVGFCFSVVVDAPSQNVVPRLSEGTGTWDDSSGFCACM